MQLAHSDDTPPAPAKLSRKASQPSQVLRTMDQILGIFDGGEYLPKVLEKIADLQAEMAAYRDENPAAKAKGSFTLTINFDLSKHRDVTMTSHSETKGPKAPPSQAVAYVTDQGELTLYSPMLRQMQVRDAYDPETGEIR